LGPPHDRLFRLGAAAGTALGTAPSVDALARYFEYWLLRLEGVYPAIDRCPRCGQRLGAGAVLVVAERRYVCPPCAQGGPRISAAALMFLRRAGAESPLEAASAATPPPVLGELEQAHELLIRLHLEKDVRSARVVRELRPGL
jgi:recombinational DNA repair protein (RecF pathway)